MGKLDEAVENGCIESLLDYGHSFTPTYSPISLPTTTSGPTIGSIFVDYQYSWFYPKTYKEETINSLIRVFTEKLVTGTVACGYNELECYNGYDLQFFPGIYCGSYSISVEIEQISYPSCSIMGEDNVVSQRVLIVTSITLTPSFLITEDQAKAVKRAIIDKLDEAIANGCIEAFRS